MLCRGALRDAYCRTPTPVAAQEVPLFMGVSYNDFGSLTTDGLSAGQRMVFRDLVNHISRGPAHIRMLRSQSHGCQTAQSDALFFVPLYLGRIQ